MRRLIGPAVAAALAASALVTPSAVATELSAPPPPRQPPLHPDASNSVPSSYDVG
jgi:hypothetical protein